MTLDNLITGVDIALGDLPVDECPAFACEETQEVTVVCLIRAENAYLHQCPS